MEDIQPVVADAPAVAQYPPTDHGGFATVNVDVTTYGIGNSADENSVAAASGSTYVDSYSINQNTVAEAGSAAMYSSAVDGTPTSGSVATHEYAAVESATAAGSGYVSTGSGINETGISASTGTTENAIHESGSATHQPENASGMSSEEDRLWALVRENSLDFNAWTALIEETEKGNNILSIQKVYDSFLAEFPLCFGYWKKYADHEGRLDTIDKVWEVYERAVLAVTYSVDIWIHYCQFAISTHSDPENIRRLFERGLAYVGTDYLSYPLWDEYISYEYGLQEWRNVPMIYTRILENPIQQLDRYYNSFKEYASSRPLSDLQTAEEAAAASANVKATEEGVEGEVRPSVDLGLTETEELTKYMETREEMYKKAKDFDSKIIAFESAIRRPYFHVRPLDDPELENWHNYLDFIQGGDDFNKVVKLYERCLIACANYPEYWMRYVLCMESSGSMELANNALARATQVFVKKQPEIRFFAARFKEHSGDILGAQAEYQYLRSEFPTVLLEAVVKHANMEMRVGNRDASFAIFEEAITAEERRESSEILPFIYVQYSRFSFLVVGDAQKAREILTSALEKVQLSRRLIEATIHLESFFPLPKRINYLDSLVEKFTTPSTDDSNKASTSDREDISCIFLEFLDLFGDTRSIKKAEDRHSSLFRHRSISVSRKRRSDHLQSEMTKMSRTQTSDQTATQSAMGSYPNAQNVWPSYGQNPPVWPQAPHAQGQQWNPGYTPQPGYSGYGGYGTYTQPQLTASVQQNTSYGAYPTTSPVQAYAQQNYSQPATSYVQQPASTAQTYCHGYY